MARFQDSHLKLPHYSSNNNSCDNSKSGYALLKIYQDHKYRFLELLEFPAGRLDYFCNYRNKMDRNTDCNDSYCYNPCTIRYLCNIY